MSYKWIFYTDKDPILELEFLRKKYNTPNKQYFFKSGKHKDKDCIFILNDLTTRIYADPVPSKQFPNELFFAPTSQVDFDDYEIHKEQREWKIPVPLKANKTIFIIPATLEPKKLVFDFNDEEGVEEENGIYSLATEYGKLAYNIYDFIESKNKLTMTDPRIKKLVMMGLMKSYNLPVDMINAAGIISAQDLDPILSACLGINPELLLKKNPGCEALPIPENVG